MIKLNERQLEIFEFIRMLGSVGNQEIRDELQNISRATILRDINFLLKQGLLEQTGKGRSVLYKEKEKYDYLKYIDVNKYFQEKFDERELKSNKFNFDIIKDIKNIFDSEELQELKNLNLEYNNRIKKLSKTILKKEFERLTIELSWKSSQIEGNTYSLIDTEILIKERKEAAGHNKEEAIMILNHKKALDYISDQRSDFKKLTLSKIENIHSLIVEDLDVGFGLRKSPVGIIGTNYSPLDNQHQILEAMQKIIKAINSFSDPFSKAIFSIIMLSYIQPFADGNKRTGRLISNAILMAHNVCPLSFRSVDEAEYKKALIIFYEQNNLRAFKDLFIEQFKFAIGNYFLISK